MVKNDPMVGSSGFQFRMLGGDFHDSRTHCFNPFSTRHKNTHIQWIEADLAGFYTFVEKQPRLTAAEELRYGKYISTWRNIEAIREKIQTKLPQAYQLTNEELAEHIGCNSTVLDSLARSADIAMIKLVNCNLKLILAVVSRYRCATVQNGELIAEGSRGLARAATRYDYRKGFRFATYATWYVHQAVSFYIKTRQHPAKMPTVYNLIRRQVKAFAEELESTTGNTPTVHELATALNRSPYDIIKVISMGRFPSLLSSPLLSNRPKSRDRTREDVLPSLESQPSTRMDDRNLELGMEELMQQELTAQQCDFLRSRLGIGDGRRKAFKEVGQQFDVTWREVRSVERDALSKLRSNSDMRSLVDSYHTV